MARERIYTRVRNETFENTIAFYLAHNRRAEAEAIRYVARQAGIAINENKVTERTNELARYANA